jgi:hypothetical protein
LRELRNFESKGKRAKVKRKRFNVYIENPQNVIEK